MVILLVQSSGILIRTNIEQCKWIIILFALVESLFIFTKHSVLGDGRWIVTGGNPQVKIDNGYFLPDEVKPADGGPYGAVDGGNTIRLITPCTDESCEWEASGAVVMQRFRWYPTYVYKFNIQCGNPSRWRFYYCKSDIYLTVDFRNVSQSINISGPMVHSSTLLLSRKTLMNFTLFALKSMAAILSTSNG